MPARIGLSALSSTGKGAPAITPAGMMGERASVIFAVPDDFNKTVASRC
jgi:cytochrome c